MRRHHRYRAAAAAACTVLSLSFATPALAESRAASLASANAVASAPTGVTATALPYAASVTWTPPTDLGAEPIDHVEVVVARAATPSVAERDVSVDPAATSAVIDDLDPVNYVTRVAYVGTSDTGAWSDDSKTVKPLLDLGRFPTALILVNQQYLDMAGRTPTDDELIGGITAIDDGSVRTTAFVASMRNQPEWGGVRSPVIRLYETTFGRVPDANGLTYWSGRLLRRSTTVRGIASAFVRSAEFHRRYASLDDAAFVTQAYANALGRTPDPKGLAYWTAKLQGGTARSALLVSLSESREHVRRSQAEVDAVLLYTGMLRRMPTPTELASSGADPVQLASTLFHSEEYAARF